MEKNKNALTFENLKESLKNTSELNFMKNGVSYEGALTLKTYLEFLVQMRTAKGQNANSILTESQLNENGFELAENAFPFYNENGDKCYDVAFIKNLNPEKTELDFEQTVGKTLANSEANESSINQEDFDAVCKTFKNVFGVKIDNSTKHSLYDPSRLKTIGRRILNFITRNKTPLTSSYGTLYIKKPEFDMESADNATKATYYYSAIDKSLDLITDGLVDLKLNQYISILEKTNAFNALDSNLKAEQRTKHAQLFNNNKYILDQICQDLLSSEIVKTLPNLSAKARYELNQSYILRASQRIASLDPIIRDNSIAMTLISSTIEANIVKYDIKARYTSSDVAKIYEQLNQKPLNTETNIAGIIYGDCEQNFAKKFAYLLSDPTKNLNLSDINENVKAQKNSEEVKVVKPNVVAVEPQAMPVQKDEVIIDSTKSEQSNRSPIIEIQEPVKVSTIIAFPENTNEDTKQPEVIQEQKAEQVVENNQSKQKNTIQTTLFSVFDKENQTTNDKSTQPVQTKLDEYSEIKSYIFNEKDLNSSTQTILSENPDEEKAQIIVADENLTPAKDLPIAVSSKNSMSTKTNEQVEQLVRSYVTNIAKKSFGDFTLKALESAKDEKRKEIASSYARMDELFYGINTKETEKSAKKAISQAMEKDGAIKHDAIFVTEMNENIDGLVKNIMMDYEKTSMTEWKSSKSVASFVNYWYNDINERTSFDGKSKTFYSCFGNKIKKDLKDYSATPIKTKEEEHIK